VSKKVKVNGAVASVDEPDILPEYDELNQRVGWSEEEYELDDIPPMNGIQKGVIVFAIIGVIVIVVYCLKHYGVF
jgi:hypothetical protein